MAGPEPDSRILLRVDTHLMPLKEEIWDARSQWKDIGHIVRTIQSLRGEERKAVGLPEQISEAKYEELALIGAPTLEELCEIYLGADWYIVGLWLGLEDTILSLIKEDYKYYYILYDISVSEKFIMLKNAMFKKYLETSYKTEQYMHFSMQLSFELQHDVDDFFSEEYSTQVVKLEEIKLKLGDNASRSILETILQKQQENRRDMKKNVLAALIRANLTNEAEKFCSSHELKLDDFIAANHLFPDPPEYVTNYARYLKTVYKQMPVMPNDWPVERDNKQQYTKLALIHASGYYKESSTMEHDYIHGKVDNIIAKKEEIEMNEVFYPIINSLTQKSRLTILMDGAPGVGKTTITRKLCIDWANGEILKEYHLVILVKLREIQFHEETKVVHLLPSATLSQVSEVAEYLENPDILGEQVLLVLDGFDELSENCRSKPSLCLKIIDGNMLQNCSILITSRPYASGVLKTLTRVNRRVEVLGFSKQQIINYVDKNLINKVHAETLIQMLKDRLDILSLCYIPLNCRIVLFVFQCLQYNLPATITELYEIFVLHTIKHHIEKCKENLGEIDDIRSLDSLSNLPPHILRNLDQLSNIAYTGMLQDKLSFQYEDVNNKEVLRLGLLTSHHGITATSMKCNYQFLHLTIQEFLAARHLVLSSENKLDFLRSHLDNSRFRMVILFLAGLSKLKFLPPNERLLGDSVLDLTSSIDEHKKSAQEKFLLLAHLVYESQLQASSQVIPIKSNILDLSNKALTRFDAFIITRFISFTPAHHYWELIDFKGCHLPLESMVFTAMHSRNVEANAIGMCKILSLRHVNVATLLPVFDTVEEISFAVTEAMSHDMVKTLCSAITNSKKLISVCVSSSIISKKSIVINRKEMSICTHSFNKLLGFIDIQNVSQLSLRYCSQIFTNCETCDQSSSNTLTSFCDIIENSSSLQDVDVSFCNLSTDSMDCLLSAVSSNHTPPLSFTLPHSPSLSPTLLHSPPLSPTLLHSPSLSPTLSHSPSLSPTLSHSPSLSPTLPHSPSLSPTFSHFPSLSPTLLHSLQRSSRCFFPPAPPAPPAPPPPPSPIMTAGFLNNLRIHGNHLDSDVALPLCKTKITEVGGFLCASYSKTITLKYLPDCYPCNYYGLKNLEYPHETFLLPDYISNVILITNHIEATKLETVVYRVAMLWKANQHLNNFVVIVDMYKLNSLLRNLEVADHKMEAHSSYAVALTRSSISISNQYSNSLPFSIESLKTLFGFVTFEMETFCIRGIELFNKCDILVDNLCKLIYSSKKLRSIELLNCNLTKKVSHSIVQSLLQSSSNVESVNFEEIYMEVNTICDLISMFVDRVQIEIGGYTFTIKSYDIYNVLNLNSLSAIVLNEDVTDAQMLIETIKLSPKTSNISISNHCYLNAQSISQFVSNNPHISSVCFSQVKGSCYDTATLAESLVKQKKLYTIRITSSGNPDSIFIRGHQFDLLAKYHTDLCICPNAFSFFTQLPEPQYLEYCNFSGQRRAFKDCSNCGSKGETAIQALCDLLSQSKTLNSIKLTDCDLNKKQLQKLSYTLRDLPQVQKLDVSGTSCDEESLTILLTTNLKEMKFLEFSLIIILDKAIKYCWKTSTENSSMLIASLVKHLLQANQHTELIMADANLTELQIKQLTQLANSSITTFHILKCSFATPHLLVSGRTFEVLTFFSTSTTSKESLGLQFFKTLNHNSFLVVLEISFINLKVDCTSEDLGGTFQIMLEENQHLQELTLNACDIDATVLCQLMKGLSKNSKLKVLHLSLLKTLNESVGPAIEFMVKENRCLHTLGISFSDIHDSVYEHIATGLGSNFTLKDLVLDGFKVTTGYFRMSNFRPTIQSVDWRKVFTILNQNNSLQTLSISTNAISKEAFDALKELLQSGPIINLYTCQCQFSPCQIQELRTILQPKGKLIHNTPYPASLHNIRNTRHIEDRLHSHF
ncbi:uncharacterized protein LOC135343054 isoform X3 [Halichondria panicea]|uniref:uncharacterized protein LOC135343054 isoform X3 n=1 Tax=Halichondria panicea TaxID=6063 RepID=UPI00312B9C3C